MAQTMKVHPNCPNASNPYHECGQYCTEKITTGRKGKKNSGPILLNSRRSFDMRVKDSKTQPKPRQAPHSVSTPMDGFVADDNPSTQLHFEKKVESRNLEPLSKFPYSSEIFVEDDITPDSPDRPKVDNFRSGKPEPEQNGNHHVPSEPLPSPGGARALSFNFSGITQDYEDSDEEVLSMISDYDSRVYVGKYHVKASVSSILRAVFAKHGDIAAQCHLASLALRAYYLECVCFVVQELRTTPAVDLTKAKIREMAAILKDVESAQIDVSWLRHVVNEIAELVEPIAQHRAIEAAKAATRKELEALMEELGVKEKEVSDMKARIAETEAKLAQIEIESSELNKDVSKVRSKVDSFDFKALIGQLA